jgi:peptide/nickel transport system permease protein
MVAYTIRRFLLMILLMVLVSVVSFVIIQLPPGDYLTTYMVRLQQSGQTADQAAVQNLRAQYGLDKPLSVQYLKWVWGMLHGNFGMSFERERPVWELIRERLPLTVALSVSSLIVTYIIAVPIGIYSATHQYSFGDYLATVIGFFGMATPNFLLALVIMYVSLKAFGFSAIGLFSPEYRLAPWSWAKLLDLLRHVPIPILIIGASSTAWLIRVMRATLLDELRKPYVTTARSKGLKENRVLFKYPVRIAINPIVSTIGWTLPSIVSGATIISIVMDIPETGPLFLQALKSQDMYLAGSFAMFLTLLTVIGTFISDLMLAALDPRIRFERES